MHKARILHIIDRTKILKCKSKFQGNGARGITGMQPAPTPTPKFCCVLDLRLRAWRTYDTHRVNAVCTITA